MTEPKDNSEYKEKRYWNDRYEKEEEYDWFKRWNDVKGVVSKFMTKTDRILHIGCGNSSLSKDLHEDGYKDVLHVDFSETCIEKMSEKFPELQFQNTDIRNMKEIEDGKYDVVLDKGTLDALEVDKSEECMEDIRKTLREIMRVLRPGGRYIQISFAQPHQRAVFSEEEFAWDLQTERIGDFFHYYIYILTKKE